MEVVWDIFVVVLNGIIKCMYTSRLPNQKQILVARKRICCAPPCHLVAAVTHGILLFCCFVTVSSTGRAKIGAFARASFVRERGTHISLPRERDISMFAGLVCAGAGFHKYHGTTG